MALGSLPSSGTWVPGRAEPCLDILAGLQMGVPILFGSIDQIPPISIAAVYALAFQSQPTHPGPEAREVAHP